MNPQESYDKAFDQGRRAALPNSAFRRAKKNRLNCPYIRGQHAVEIDGVYIKTKPVWYRGWTAGWDSVVAATQQEN